MAALHQLLHDKQWGAIQDAVRKDASVAMRTDDSREEDRWFDEARRRKAAMEGIKTSSIVNGDAGTLGAGDGASDLQTGEIQDDVPTELRYWVSPNADGNILANVHMRQRRTLLHSLCRMPLPSNEALVVQLSSGDTRGLKQLMGAVKTARMLINASHNMPIGLNNDNQQNAEGGDEGSSMCEESEDESAYVCNDCPCQFYKHYCPPVQLPPVESQPDGSGEQIDFSGISSEDNMVMIQHTSVLTMTDAMGETPLHTLTGAGSCHPDLIQVFVDGCRPLEETRDNGDLGGDRRPTVYDLLVARNFYGCTPCHFLADGEYEEELRSLLGQCPLSDNRTHPTMISDNEGDLPLHFAACNGASRSLLHTLTASHGDGLASVARNSQGRLALDEHIAWYVDNLNENYLELPEAGEVSESDSDDDSSGSSESSSASSIDSAMKEGLVNPKDHRRKLRGETPESYIASIFGRLSTTDSWKSELWGPMSILIEAAVKSVVKNLVTNGHLLTEEAQLPSTHAAVIATKSANFPALAVVASIARDLDNGDDTREENERCWSQKTPSLLKEDEHGKLPLHWACTGIPNRTTESDDLPFRPSTAQCKEIARWKSSDLPYSMIEYLLYREPAAARIPTREGRLPLHFLVEGMALTSVPQQLRANKSDDNECISEPWDDVRILLRQFPESLGVRDPVRQLYPFQLAAASPLATSIDEKTGDVGEYESSDLLCLDLTYRLIMEDPSLLCQIIGS